MKYFTSSLVVILLFVCMVEANTSVYSIPLQIEPQKQATIASGDNWLDGWTYRKPHVISQTVGADVNYTVYITVNGGVGSDSGDTVYLNGKGQDDFGDVRFTDSTGDSLLNYWMESNVTGSESTEFFYDGITTPFYSGQRPYAYYDPTSNTTFIALMDSNHDPYVMYYNHTTSLWSNGYVAGTNQLPFSDLHGGPTLWVSVDGYIHVLFGAHGEGGNSIQHRKTTNPYDISSWQNGATLASGQYPTYPFINYDAENEVVHVIYRSRNGASGENDLKYVNSTDDGATWSTAQIIVDVDQVPVDEAVYTGSAIMDPLSTDLIHISFKVYNFSVAAEERLFYTYLNVTSGILYNVTGDSMGTSISGSHDFRDITFYGSLGTGERPIDSKVRVDSSHIPYIVFTNITSAPNNLTRYFTFWNASSTSWTNPEKIGDNLSFGERAQTDFVINGANDITLFMPMGKNLTRWSWDGSTWALEEWIRNSTTTEVGVGQIPYFWNGTYNPEISFVYGEWKQDATNLRAWAWGSSGNVDSTGNSGYANFWVKISGNLTTSDQTIYVYYGNESVDSLSDGYATFPLYDDWESESIDSDIWNIVLADGSSSYSSVGATHGTIMKMTATNALSYVLTTKYNATAPFAIMGRIEIDATSTGNTGVFGAGWASAYGFAQLQTAGTTTKRFRVYDDLGNSDIDNVAAGYFGSWYVFTITRDGTNCKLYADDSLLLTQSWEPDAVTTNPALHIGNYDAENFVYADWILGRYFLATEPTHGSWGSEEIYEGAPPAGSPEWTLINSIPVYIVLPIDESAIWALNGWYIVLGAGMVVFSTCFAAVKIKSREGGTDDILLFLVLFVFGWALIIGSVM